MKNCIESKMLLTRNWCGSLCKSSLNNFKFICWMDFSREFQSINFEFFRLVDFTLVLKFTLFVGIVDWGGKFSVPFSDKVLESWVLSTSILGRVVPSTDDSDLGALSQELLYSLRIEKSVKRNLLHGTGLRGCRV